MLAAQKPHLLKAAFGSGSAMRTFLVLALTGHPFDPTARYFKGKSWKELEQYLLAMEFWEPDGINVRLVLAHWQLKRALAEPDCLPLFPSSALGHVGAEFDWKCFETFFVHLLACRVLALLLHVKVRPSLHSRWCSHRPRCREGRRLSPLGKFSLERRCRLAWQQSG
jgi:hypothetical protein